MASKTNRKQRLLSSLVINSPKKLLLFFIITFALSGAGVLVYRSFAHHNTTQEDVEFADEIFYHGGWTSKELETSSNKRGSQIWRMFSTGAIRNVFELDMPTWGSYEYGICMMAKLHEGSEAYVTITPADDKWNIRPLDPWRIRFNEGVYQKTCIPINFYRLDNVYPGRVLLHVIYTNWGPGAVNVAFVSVRYQRAGINPALLPYRFVARRLPDTTTIW